jgi:hypothetical protein
VKESTARLQVALYRGDPSERRSVGDLVFGSPLGQLVEGPFYFAKVNKEGAIRLTVQRKHEWELVNGLALIGAAVFFKGALKELGKQFGKWVADQVKKLGAGKQADVRAGKVVRRIDLSQPGAAEDELALVLKEAITNRARVQIIVVPKAMTGRLAPGARRRPGRARPRRRRSRGPGMRSFPSLTRTAFGERPTFAATSSSGALPNSLSSAGDHQGPRL